VFFIKYFSTDQEALDAAMEVIEEGDIRSFLESAPGVQH